MIISSMHWNTEVIITALTMLNLFIVPFQNIIWMKLIYQLILQAMILNFHFLLTQLQAEVKMQKKLIKNWQKLRMNAICYL